MDCNPQRVVAWWLVVFYSVSTLAESRLFYNQASNVVDFFKPPAGTSGRVPARLSAVQQQASSQLDERPRPIVVRCHPDSMEIVVQADLFDTGLQVDGEHLRLGSNFLSKDGECGAVPSGEDDFTIVTQLTDCGTKLSSTEEKIIYSNVLVYSPEPSADGLLRLDGATIPVECHYEKRYSVDGISLNPTWVPFVSTTSVDDQIDFNLQIMTDDWQFERESYIYFLGDPIHVEVSAMMGNHLPLRVYVDHCVATATPDPESSLRYDFIEHHGCLADAYLTNSNSRYLPRLDEHKLRFQIDAFNFYQEPSNQIYITCHLKAVPVALSVSSRNRACSLIGNRWQSIDGSDQACRSCDLSQREEEPPTEPPTAAPTTTTTVAPQTHPIITLEESKNEHYPATYIRVHPAPYQGIKRQQSSKLVKRNAEHKAQQAIQLGPLTIMPFSKSVSRELLAQKNKTA
ncbi:zona pellucida sperm-binding protein 3-like [Cololabis saira]|uniref:zona pellucida sperm-binding protein 3-like n=1 Tax=Cololabis saira TaxID=129043 RepID=UPI002AD33574|nr:zona pellucida sperm-binding protein 3-like [Cololabis saira]